MGEGKYEKLTDAELEMMAGATVEPSKEEVEAAQYSPDQQRVVNAFEAIANQSEDYRRIVDRLKEGGIFEGKGDAYEQILKAVNNLEERGLSLEQIDEALDKQVANMIGRYSEKRAA
jgi:tryptophanyl-tRNA synthetase